MPKVCTKCGKNTPEMGRWCPGCGGLFWPLLLNNQPETGSPLACSICGTLNPGNIDNCTNCGAILQKSRPAIIGENPGFSRGGRISLNPGELEPGDPSAQSARAAGGRLSRLAQAREKMEADKKGSTGASSDWLDSLRSDKPANPVTSPAPAIPTGPVTPAIPTGPAETSELPVSPPAAPAPAAPKTEPLETESFSWTLDEAEMVDPAPTPAPVEPVGEDDAAFSNPSLDDLPDDTTLPDWLKNLKYKAEQSSGQNQSASNPSLASDSEEDMPEITGSIPQWLRDFAVASSNLPTGPDPEEILDEKEVDPAFLEEETALIPDTVEPELPDWLRSARVDTFITQEAPQKDILDWLKGPSQPLSGTPERPSFGDVDVEERLNFAFEEPENSAGSANFGDAGNETGRPRSGLTDILGFSPYNSEGNQAPFHWQQQAAESLPNPVEPDEAFPDIPDFLAEPSFVETPGNRPAPEPVYSALPVWLNGLKPPALDAGSEGQFPVDENGTTGPVEPGASPAGNLAPWLQGLQPPELEGNAALLLNLDELLNSLPPIDTSSGYTPQENDAQSARDKGTRPFSVGAMFHQTDYLSERFVGEGVPQSYPEEESYTPGFSIPSFDTDNASQPASRAGDTGPKPFSIPDEEGGPDTASAKAGNANGPVSGKGGVVFGAAAAGGVAGSALNQGQTAPGAGTSSLPDWLNMLPGLPELSAPPPTGQGTAETAGSDWAKPWDDVVQPAGTGSDVASVMPEGGAAPENNQPAPGAAEETGSTWAKPWDDVAQPAEASPEGVAAAPLDAGNPPAEGAASTAGAEAAGVAANTANTEAVAGTSNSEGNANTANVTPLGEIAGAANTEVTDQAAATADENTETESTASQDGPAIPPAWPVQLEELPSLASLNDGKPPTFELPDFLANLDNLAASDNEAAPEIPAWQRLYVPEKTADAPDSDQPLPTTSGTGEHVTHDTDTSALEANYDNLPDFLRDMNFIRQDPVIAPATPTGEETASASQEEAPGQPWDFDKEPGQAGPGAVPGGILALQGPDQAAQTTEAANPPLAEDAPTPNSPVSEQTEDAIPDWLKALSSGAQPEVNIPRAGSTYTEMNAGYHPEPAEEVALPDWLREDNAASSENSFNPDNLEDWQPPVDSDEKPVQPKGASLETRELPEWLQETTNEPAPANQPDYPLPSELPDWLQEPESPVLLYGENDYTGPNNLRNPDAGPEVNYSSLLEEVPVNIPGQFSGGSFFSDMEGPAWLRQANQPKPPEPSPEASAPAVTTPEQSMPNWLRSINSPAGEETAPQAVDEETASPPPDAGVKPVTIQPAVRTQKAEEWPSVHLPPQLASATVLEALLKPPTQPVTQVEAPVKKRRMGWLRSNITRYILSLLLIGVALIGLLQPLPVGSQPVSANVQTFYDQVDRLPANSKVLVAFDWEADRSGEMGPLSRSVVQHVMAKRARLVSISLNPQGPALAARVTDDLATNAIYGNSGFYKYGTTYLNLGWRSGQEAGLRSLFNSMGDLTDYKNGQRASTLAATRGINSLNDFDLIVVLAGDEGGVRSWVEQVGVQPGVRLIMGVPLAVEPVARPYAQGLSTASPDRRTTETQPRAQALIAGLNQTAQYDQLLQDKLKLKTDPTASLEGRLSAQSLAALLLIAVIIFGNLVFLTRRRR